jgi:hypothetical protein
VPRSRAAPLNDPAGVVQRVGTVNHADRTHSARPKSKNAAFRENFTKLSDYHQSDMDDFSNSCVVVSIH